MNLELDDEKHILCRYKEIEDHPDPCFKELTYGECSYFAPTIREHIKAGSHYFFQTTINRQRYITAHYFVEKVVEGCEARRDNKIKNKYKNNPHIHPEEHPIWWGGSYDPEDDPMTNDGDIIIFGDKKRSLGKLKTPLPLDRELGKKLEFESGKKIKYDIVDKNGEKLTDTACLSSCTRVPRLITKNDVITLFNAISLMYNKE